MFDMKENHIIPNDIFMKKWPIYDDDERRGLEEVLVSQRWGGGRTYSTQLEQSFCRYCGTKYSMSVCNATSGFCQFPKILIIISLICCAEYSGGKYWLIS